MDLPPEEIAYQNAHITQDRRPALIVLCSIFTGLALLLFLLRILARRVVNAGIGLDDWLAFISTVRISFLDNGSPAYRSTDISHRSQHHSMSIGFIWNREALTLGGGEASRKFRQDTNCERHPRSSASGIILHSRLTKVKQIKVVFSFLYVFCICFAKLSVLALYNRIFSQSDRIIRIGIWICAAYTVLWGVAVQLAMGLATHINASFSIPWGMSISIGITNCVGEVAILLLPQPLIWKLHQTLRKRMFLSGLFFLGVLFVTNPDMIAARYPTDN